MSPNEAIERPIIMNLLGSPEKLDVLDLGCGDGAFGETLINLGAKSYFGIDGSAKMVTAAKNRLVQPEAQVTKAALDEWKFPSDAFDLVSARLVLHYLANLDGLVLEVYRTLRPGGRLLFSVEHPVITSSNKGLGVDGKRQDWIVDDYFVSGARNVSWLGAEVTKYHRTIQEYLQTIEASGLIFKTLRESNPDPANIPDPVEFKRRQRIPLFLILMAQKPL